MRVIPYPTFSFVKVLSVDSVCNDILGTALDVENHIDCVIFVDGLYFRGKRARVPLSLRRAGIPTVLIATDDPYESLANVESLYTYRFTNEIHCATEGAVYLPTATLPLPAIPRTQHPSLRRLLSGDGLRGPAAAAGQGGRVLRTAAAPLPGRRQDPGRHGAVSNASPAPTCGSE